MAASALAASNLAICPLLIAGSEEQKQRYLSRLTAEPACAAFAITEPDSVTAALAIRTHSY